MQCIVTYATGVCCSYLKSVLSTNFLFWTPVIRTPYIDVRKDMGIRGYFSKPKGVREQKSLGNTDVGSSRAVLILHAAANSARRYRVQQPPQTERYRIQQPPQTERYRIQQPPQTERSRVQQPLTNRTFPSSTATHKQNVPEFNSHSQTDELT
jgi:hypothetical protein